MGEIIDNRIDIKSLLPEEIANLFARMSLPRYRAFQVFKWLSTGCESFDDMTNLSKKLREQLNNTYHISKLSILRKQVSAIDGTIKYLWQLGDGNSIESVIMSYEHGNTICISSQVGCKMGCAFCASTLGGLIRNLSPSEMLDQITFSQRDSGMKISNIVLMGIGEPLDNFDNVLKFLQLANHPMGLNIGMRHVSLSTCGIVENIDKLAEYNLQLTLSISLHAPDNETRSKLMPINRKYDIHELLDACSRYFEKTGRRISFEYAMVGGVNDTPEHAEKLALLLRGTGAHVNLIALNNVSERDLTASTPESIKTFIKILKQRGINVTVRRRLGSDIDASCGQLRRNTQKNLF